MQKPVSEKKKYFVVRERAVPEVLLKVVEAREASGLRQGGYRAGCGRADRNQQEFFLQIQR